MAYIDTPRTDAGNATFLDQGRGIDDVSQEMSFHAPKNRQGDLLSQMRGKSNGALKTPSTRRALVDVPNLAFNGGPGEFTPLLKSARKHMARRPNNMKVGPRTPGILRALHEEDEDIGLPISESSMVGASDTENTDVVMKHTGVNSLPNANSSAIMSTPMGSTGQDGRMLGDQRNLMTLREQENIINKTEKENFGLKLKIHYLEEMLAKSDPNLNQEAIRQNTDLKVDRATLQRELSKIKKQLQVSARDSETLRRQMLENQAKSDQKIADKRLRQELEILQETVQTKEREIERLQHRLESEGRTQEVEDLKATVEDLEADLREKDRLIEAHEDEKETDTVYAQRIRDLQEELEEAKERIHGLQNQGDDGADIIHQAKIDLAEAQEGERRAEHQRDEVIDASREQLEKSQSEFRTLREKYELLKDGYKNKSQIIQDLEKSFSEARNAARAREEELIQENESIRRRSEDLLQAHGPSEERIQDIVRQLNAKSDEKELLQTRHDALTDESEQLQRDLARLRTENIQLQAEVNAERQRSKEQERFQTEDNKKAQEKLVAENSRLRTSIEVELKRADNVDDQWRSKCKDLQTQKDMIERRTISLQQTVDKLQKAEGDLSSRESRLLASLEAEKQRNQSEEMTFQRQIRELQMELSNKRKTVEQHSTELAASKEQLRLRQRELENALQKHEALEDEIVVLQSSVEEGSEQARQDIIKLKEELRNQRTQSSTDKVELSRLRSDLQLSKTEIQSLKDDIKGRSSRKNQSETRVSELRDLVALLQTDNRALATKLADTENHVKDLELQSQLKHKDSSLLQHNHEDQQAKIFGLETERRTLTRQLRAAEDKVKQFESQAQTERENQSLFRHQSDERQDKVLELQVEKNSLSLRLSEALQRAQDLESKLTAEQKSNNLIRDRLDNQASLDSGVSQREAALHLEVSRLKAKIADLCEQVHSNPIPRTPARSPVPSSLATPNEIAELRRQLDDARKQSRQYRDQIGELEKKFRKADTGYNRQSFEHDDEIWQLRRDLEKKTHDLELGQAELGKIRDAVDKSNAKLRTRIQELEKDLVQARLSRAEDDTVALERGNLHEMIKSAKLEAEGLRVKLNEVATEATASQEREQALRTTMQRIRDERAEQQQRATSKSKELAKLQERYDDKVEELYQRNNQINVSQPKDRKTTAEMKGLAKQIEWLKQNLDREKAFRQSLAFEKHYYLQQIDMYNACNAVDIQILKQMGCYTKAPKKKRPTSLRPIVSVIIALIRMRNLSHDWKSENKQHADFVKKIELARGKRKVSALKK